MGYNNKIYVNTCQVDFYTLQVVENTCHFSYDFIKGDLFYEIGT